MPARQIGRRLRSQKISTANLFNSVILLFNPSLKPLLFSLGQSVDARHSPGGGDIKTKWKSGGLKRARGRQKEGASSGKGRGMASLWRAAVPSLDLQCEGDGL